MSSEAITRNDLTNILNGVLPPTASEYKKLLWTNPSPTSSFAAQTIPLDLSNYDAIEIIIRSDTANTYTLAPIVTEVGKGGIAFNSTAYNSGRQFTTTTSGITFTGATYYSAYGNWSTTSTNALIPVYIYGIKYERVNPPQVEIADVVIEQGTELVGSATWTYRKWNSGIAECWTKVLHTITSWTAWYSWYYSNPDSTTFSFPTNLFIDVPIVEASRSSGIAGILCEEGAPTKTATQKYYLVRPDAPSANGFNLDIYAIGKWK